jgi:hypothetical protein
LIWVYATKAKCKIIQASFVVVRVGNMWDQTKF